MASINWRKTPSVTAQMSVDIKSKLLAKKKTQPVENPATTPSVTDSQQNPVSNLGTSVYINNSPVILQVNTSSREKNIPESNTPR